MGDYAWESYYNICVYGNTRTPLGSTANQIAFPGYISFRHKVDAAFLYFCKRRRGLQQISAFIIIMISIYYTAITGIPGQFVCEVNNPSLGFLSLRLLLLILDTVNKIMKAVSSFADCFFCSFMRATMNWIDLTISHFIYYLWDV